MPRSQEPAQRADALNPHGYEDWKPLDDGPQLLDNAKGPAQRKSGRSETKEVRGDETMLEETASEEDGDGGREKGRKPPAHSRGGFRPCLLYTSPSPRDA